MGYTICNNCNQIFNYPGFGKLLCKDCRKKEENNIAKIKKYLMEHPDADDKDVSKITGLSIEVIDKWAADGEFDIKINESAAIRCKNCGTPIRTGKLCENCKTELAKGFASVATKKPSKIKPSNSGAMHFFKR